MSVYTTVNSSQLERFLSLYSIGKLVDFSGIKAGIENSNFAVKTTQGKFILTLFESLTEKDLAHYFCLLNTLCNNNFPAPQPQCSNKGYYLNQLKGKPAGLFICLPGESINKPSIKQCAEIGRYLAKLHLTSRNSHFYQKNTKNLVACKTMFDKVSSYLNDKDKKVLRAEFDFHSSYSLPALAKGVIHADLFKDNVLFEGDHLSGIVDFYNACHDVYIFDIAIAINDWCVENGGINLPKYNALLTAYQQLRCLDYNEKHCLPLFLRRAALRFWLSRVDHQLYPKEGEMVLQKDPLVFRRLLKFYQQYAFSHLKEYQIG